jgi:Tfp pilus assembly protein PilX
VSTDTYGDDADQPVNPMTLEELRAAANEVVAAKRALHDAEARFREAEAAAVQARTARDGAHKRLTAARVLLDQGLEA